MNHVRQFLSAITAISLIILVAPVSPNYSLRELDFGGGGGTGQSSQYKIEGHVSDQGGLMNGSTYNGGIGFGFTQMAFVPAAPSLTNPNNYYNKLHLTINNSGNPTDALFAIAISNDNFTTTQYVKSDQAIGSSLTFADYQSYASWGGGSGFDILGLSPGTTYYVKIKAMHGQFTESSFGPSSNASTVNPSLSFDIDVAATDTPTAPPYNLSMGTLLAGSVLTASDKIWVSLDSNAENGSSVYFAGQNGSLSSSLASYSITSATADLAAASQGFGLRGDTITQSAGGPLAYESGYALTNDNVAAIPTTLTKIASSPGPLTSGRASLLLKAKASTSAPASNDYQELLTLIAAAAF